MARLAALLLPDGHVALGSPSLCTDAEALLETRLRAPLLERLKMQLEEASEAKKDKGKQRK